MNKTIYSLVVINEEQDLVYVAAYPTYDSAIDALEHDYHTTKKMLELEGWSEDKLSGDEYDTGLSYFIQYGSSSYFAKIKETILYE